MMFQIKTIGKIYDGIPKSEIEEEKKRKDKVPYYNGAKYKKNKPHRSKRARK